MAGEWNLFQYQLQTVLVGVIVAGGLSAGVAEAQLTPDNSLGSESSVVNPIDTLIDLIEGGARRGSNLFHSFQEFNVDFGRAVYFNPNNAAILNILTRVTGANPSNINGVLGVLGNANLFLINPNGIIFGAGASLDLNGSFIGSTADSILFDNFEFSASNPQAVPLTVNIPIGLGFRDNPGDITVNSVVSDVTFGFNLNANVVNNSQNIALIGGNVDISGFVLGETLFPVDIRFPGANITFGGVAEAGEVSFNETLNFNFPNNVEQGNVLINNASILTGVTQDANFKQSGNINILGKQIAINNSNVSTGILTGTELLSGDITIGDSNLTETVLINNSNIATTLFSNTTNPDVSAINIAGNLSISGDQIEIRDNSFINTSVTTNFSVSGDITIGNQNLTTSILIAENSIVSTQPLLLDSLGTLDSSFSGNITLNAREEIRITDNSLVATIASLSQATTNLAIELELTNIFNILPVIIINASEGSIFIDNSEISSSNINTGFAGTIRLNAADTINITNGSNITSEGNLGEIFIGDDNDPDTNLVPPQNINIDNSTISAENLSTEQSQFAGTIVINAEDTITISNFSKVTGEGSLGEIFIGDNNDPNTDLKPQTINVNNSTISTDNRGNGIAGSITLKVDDSLNLDTSSILSSNTNGGLSAGSITLDSQNLIEMIASEISASTFTQGDAGNVILNAEKSISFDNSFIFSTVEAGAIGNGGSISINTGLLTLENLSQLQTLVRGSIDTTTSGDAGNILIRVDEVFFSNSGIFSNVQDFAQGNGGIISIDTGSLSLTNNSTIQTSITNNSIGEAGFIGIEADKDISLSNNSRIFSGLGNFAQGNGGIISIDTGSLSLTEGSIIATSIDDFDDSGEVILGASNSIAGDILIDVTGDISLSDSSSIASTLGFQSEGEAGNIAIFSQNLSLDNSSSINASTSGFGNVGNIFIFVDDSVTLTNSSQIRNNVEQGGNGIGGNIFIEAKSVSLLDGSPIGAVVFRDDPGLQLGIDRPGGRGTGGNIFINATDFVLISGVSDLGFSSEIIASTERDARGNAGLIEINTGNLLIEKGGTINTITSNEGNAGLIRINANSLNITEGGQILNTTRDSGNAGDIILNITEKINIAGEDPTFTARIQEFGEDVVNNQSEKSGIFANTTQNSTGDGGNITITNPNEIILTSGSRIQASSEGLGNGGRISITGDNLDLRDNAEISAFTFSGAGGEIDFNLSELLIIRDDSAITAQAFEDANGGNLDIQALLVALLGNSRIEATAERGDGGFISFTTDGLLVSTDSIIDASSDTGTDGVVETNTPDIDPSQGLIQLPQNVIDANELVAQNACQEGEESSLIVTGKGGLPPNSNPTTAKTDLTEVELIPWQEEPETEIENETEEIPSEVNPDSSLKPAKGWVVNEQGEIFLVSYNPTDKAVRRNTNIPQCQPK